MALKKQSRGIIYPVDKKAREGVIMRAIDRVIDKKEIYFNEIEKIKEVKTAIYFRNNPVHFPFAIPNIKTKIGWWMCDLRPPSAFARVDYFDAVFLCNKQYLKEYEDYFGCPAFYVPQCGSSEPLGNPIKIDWDIVFIGNFYSKYHQNRLPIINEIKKNYELKIISGDTNNTPSMGYIYKNSPFCLAVSPQYDGYTSNRLYNILAYGGFCLTLYFKGIEDLFENHKHLVWFHKAEEINDIMEYYYNHPLEYEKIKKQGREEYLKKHTAERRLEKMFSILEKL